MDVTPIPGASLFVAPPSKCDEFHRLNKVNFGVSIFILFGILVSYLPQHYRIIARRSSEGLSPYFVLLGTTSGTCAFFNILTLQGSRDAIACCAGAEGGIPAFACGAALMGIAQVGVQWACFFVIMLLFLIFYPRDTDIEQLPDRQPDSPSTMRTSLLTPTTSPAPTHPREPHAHPGAKPPAHPYRLAVLTVALSLTHLLILFLLTLFLYTLAPRALTPFANVLGLCASVLASIQYLPQIVTTFRLRAVHSLSIPMMCIQTPGSFVWAASLAARLGWAGWSAWLVYVVTGCLQGGLLVMGIMFEVRAWRKRKARVESWDADGEGIESYHSGGAGSEGGESEGEADVNERTPLVGSGGRVAKINGQRRLS
ncbi:hypothetical protein BDY21DRAFT_339288 [Lineolata rhizophorae]|uniref:PQ loop repeat-domain-containing protein n=1 Tax=Lineolata rhizophorae TaxID=578093 RepID=A0A6A6P4J5_9PEZI|nr:hypothetical protein BDY21DRAFT_339288 [Lineolata rhizophorae]